MLPTGKKDKGTALQTILYTIWLIIASLLPAIFPYTGIVGSRLYLSPISAIIVFLLGIWMLFYAFELYKKRTVKPPEH
jgi:protoheme IX farnesyltransferase